MLGKPLAGLIDAHEDEQHRKQAVVGCLFVWVLYFWTSEIKYLAHRRKEMVNTAQCLLVIAHYSAKNQYLKVKCPDYSLASNFQHTACPALRGTNTSSVKGKCSGTCQLSFTKVIFSVLLGSP